MMKSPLRILHLEDDPKDAELIQALLETEGFICHVTRVETQTDFLVALEQGGFDLILADYTLPSFDGLSALTLTREQCPEVPLIFVSGTLGEEVAIDALKLGATDYVLKERLSRIVPSVRRALREAHERTTRKRAEAERHQADAELRQIVDVVPQHIFVLEPDGRFRYANQRDLEYTGLTREDVRAPDFLARSCHPDDLQRLGPERDQAIARGVPWESEARILGKDGQYRWFLIRLNPLRDEQGRTVRWYGTRTDIEDRKRAEETLKRSEAYLSEAQRLSHTGSFSWRVSTGEIIWSEETFRIFQYDPTTQPSVALVLQRVHPEDAAFMQQTLERASQDGMDLDFEHRLLMPDGSVKHVRVVGHAESVNSSERKFVGAVMDVTERKRAERALRRARERTLEARFAAVLDERTRLARDIHDTLLQGFTGIALKLVAAVSRVTEPVESVVALRDLVGLAQQTLTDARRAVWDLRSPALAGGELPAAVRTAAEDCVRGTTLELEYDVGGPPRPVDADVEAVVIRVAQEAITNVVKHADAHTVRVRLSFETRRIRLSVIDDGRGFTVAPDFQAYGGHWGLLGMRERASQVHGKLSLRSTPSHGTEVVLLVPYAPSQQSPAASAASSSAS
jgi:PAS domain S-box-containing protein